MLGHGPNEGTAGEGDSMTEPRHEQFQFITDLGGGWLRVPHTLVAQVGIQPTPFSYRDANYTYLEEDREAPAFESAYSRRFPERPAVTDCTDKVHTNSKSFVRSLDRW